MGQKISHVGACGASTVRDMGSAIAARPGSVLGRIHTVKDVLTDFDLGFAAGTDFGVRLAKAAQKGGFPDDGGDYRSMAQMLIRIFDDSGNGKLEAEEVYNMVQSIAQVFFAFSNCGDMLGGAADSGATRSSGVGGVPDYTPQERAIAEAEIAHDLLLSLQKRRDEQRELRRKSHVSGAGSSPAGHRGTDAAAPAAAADEEEDEEDGVDAADLEAWLQRIDAEHLMAGLAPAESAGPSAGSASSFKPAPVLDAPPSARAVKGASLAVATDGLDMRNSASIPLPLASAFPLAAASASKPAPAAAAKAGASAGLPPRPADGSAASAAAGPLDAASRRR